LLRRNATWHPFADYHITVSQQSPIKSRVLETYMQKNYFISVDILRNSLEWIFSMIYIYRESSRDIWNWLQIEL
jgi:hypothetical protein